MKDTHELTGPRAGVGGVLIVIAGVWLLLDQLGVDRAGQWWPLFWVLAGAVLYVFSQRGRFVTLVAGFMVLGGVLAQANSLGLTVVTLDDVFWPVLLILVGLTMFTHRPSVSLFGGRGQVNDSSDKVDCTAVFGSQERRLTSASFGGGEATAVFGGVELDLRPVKLNDSASLELTAVFGSVKIMVADDVAVDVTGLPIFGGVDDKTSKSGQKRLAITATAVFGGVEITN